MSDGISISVSQIFNSDLAAYANRIAFSLAQQTADALQKEYSYVISRFYGEYDPKVYKRHDPPGLPKSLNIALYPSKGGMYGGIELSSENMYNDYDDPPDIVLKHFLDGYHGDPSRKIKSSIETEDYMTRYCDKIAVTIQGYVPKAQQYARGFSYNVISF